MTTDTDTAAALEAAIDAIACRRCDSDDPIGSTDRSALHRAITAHVEAEVARRLAVAPDVEAAIGDLRANAHTHAVGALAMADVDECHAALLAAIAADKARAVEAESIAAIDEFRRILTAPRAAGVPCPVCKVARPTPDEARSIGRVAEHLRGLAAEVEPSRMADGFEADRMRLLAHRLRQVAALMPDSDEARRLVEDLAGAQGAWVALLAGNLADSGSIAGSEAVLTARVTAARTALLRALGVEA